MNSNELPRKTDFFTIAKIILAISVFISSIVFSTPLSRFLSEKSEKLFPLGVNAEMINTGNYEKEQPVSFAEESTEKICEQVSDRDSLKYETPEDVLNAEKEYIAAFSAKTAGTVKEVFFRSSGSTDFVQGIYIKNATETKKPDFESLLNNGPELDINDKSEPCVLIFHTHTTESYLLSDSGEFYEGYETRSTDSRMNMIRVGEEICKVLEENGIGFIHDKKIYDESYDGAYSRSRVSVEKYLEEYPSIKIVLDVHRDAIYYSDTSHCKPTAVIADRKAAQIMIISGAEEGYISSFPDWEDNLKFALCFQKKAEELYEGLMKPLYFCPRKYNMDTAKCSLLLEVGTDANTLDEALYSGHLTGMILSSIIGEYSNEKT